MLSFSAFDLDVRLKSPVCFVISLYPSRWARWELLSKFLILFIDEETDS